MLLFLEQREPSVTEAHGWPQGSDQAARCFCFAHRNARVAEISNMLVRADMPSCGPDKVFTYGSLTLAAGARNAAQRR